MSAPGQELDFEALAQRLSFTEILRLQDTLSRALTRRFEQHLALAFSDVVGSSAYFARFGNEAGRALQLRHVDLLSAAIAPHAGRIVDTAGDGAFLCFPDVVDAARALVDLQDRVALDNEGRAAEHRLELRIGLHHGRVLTDGQLVSGDAVNLCARVASAAEPREIVLTRAACEELYDAELRTRCQRKGAAELKGIPGRVELLRLDWRDPARFPTLVRFEDGTEVQLPAQAVVRFGRLSHQGDAPGNDVVISAASPGDTARVSRFHFELHLHATGYRLRSVTNAATEVDGRPVAKGEERTVGPGATIRVGGVLTLVLGRGAQAFDATLMPG